MSAHLRRLGVDLSACRCGTRSGALFGPRIRCAGPQGFIHRIKAPKARKDPLWTSGAFRSRFSIRPNAKKPGVMKTRALLPPVKNFGRCFIWGSEVLL